MMPIRMPHWRFATIVFTPLMASSLSGCVNLSGLSGETQYACAAPEGVACQSVSGTYANAVHQNLPSQRAAAASKAQTSDGGGRASTQPAISFSKSSPPRLPVRPGIAPTAQSPASQADPDGLTLTALRSQVRVLRLWTKPWEDADGDLWDQGYVYVQIDDGHWQIDHVQQQIRDRYAPLRPPPSTPSSPTASGSAATQADDSTDATNTSPQQRPSASSPIAGQRQPSPFPSLTLPSSRPGLGSPGAMGAQ